MLPGSDSAVAPKCEEFTKVVSRPVKVEKGKESGKTAMVEKDENSRGENGGRKHAYYIMSPAELSEVCDNVLGTVM